MEFQLAAVLSDCRIMLELYASGDPYLNFAKIVGAVPQTATKTSHAAVRDMYKVVLLVRRARYTRVWRMRTGISITLKPADRRRLATLARDRNAPHKSSPLSGVGTKC
jgi:hypothetical protein